MKTIPLTFDGYWREVNKGNVPTESGIYCVYACTFNQAEKTVSIRELVYIGESDNVKERLDNHERLHDWKKRLKVGETLCYSVAEIGNVDRVRAEAAMIYQHKPPCNTEYKYSFPYPETAIKAFGKSAKLTASFTVYQTA